MPELHWQSWDYPGMLHLAKRPLVWKTSLSLTEFDGMKRWRELHLNVTTRLLHVYTTICMQFWIHPYTQL